MDQRGESYVRILWDRLGKAGIPCGANEYPGSRPHLTFSIFTGCGKERAAVHIAAIARTTPPIRIELTDLGLFTLDGMTAYLAVRPGRRIRALHRRIDTAAAGCARALVPYYRTDQWVPHCTLSGALDAAHLPIVRKIAEELVLPRRFLLTGLGVTELDHEQQRWSYERDFPFVG